MCTCERAAQGGGLRLAHVVAAVWPAAALPAGSLGRRLARSVTRSLTRRMTLSRPARGSLADLNRRRATAVRGARAECLGGMPVRLHEPVVSVCLTGTAFRIAGPGRAVVLPHGVDAPLHGVAHICAMSGRAGAYRRAALSRSIVRTTYARSRESSRTSQRLHTLGAMQTLRGTSSRTSSWFPAETLTVSRGATYERIALEHKLAFGYNERNICAPFCPC